MKTVKSLIYSVFILQLISCGEEKETNTITLQFINSTKIFKLGEALDFTVKEKSGKKIDSLVYTFQGKSVKESKQNISIPLNGVLLGKHKLQIKSYVEGKVKVFNPEVSILNDKAPEVFGYKIVKTFPHSIEDYTQGLEFKDDQLYESTGKPRGSRLSRLLEKDLATGKTLKEHKLGDTFFGEGLTIVGDKIHQLTWKGDLGFTYNLSDFKTLGTFAYDQSKQGWGLCYDGKNTIYKSDGTTKIWKLNAQTLKEESFIQITTNKALKSKFNELEWIDGKIYANTYQKDSIAIINPENGAIEAIINLSGIRKEVGVDPKDNDKVLNGIAYKPETKQLYVTGKYWNKLFEIEVIK